MSGRKCVKCDASIRSNPELTMHRFPILKSKNPRIEIKARRWAEFCFPGETWDIDKLQGLYVKHILICSKHFPDSAWQDNTRRKLNMFAVPEEKDPLESLAVPEEENQLESLAIPEEENQQIESLAVAEEENPLESFAGPEEENQLESLAVPEEKDPLESLNITVCESVSQNIFDTPSPTSNTSFTFDIPSTCGSPTSSIGKRRSKIVKGVSHLTPRKLKLYKRCRMQVEQICKLWEEVKEFNLTASEGLKLLHDSEQFKNLNVSKEFCVLLERQVHNSNKNLNGRWTLKDKVMALSIYKKSPARYRLLRKLWCLPSQGLLKILLNSIHLKCGVNEQVLLALQQLPDDDDEDRMCILTFDEMSLRENVTYNVKDDEMDGYKDFGQVRRFSSPVTSALVFMVIGITEKWNQPIAHYFTGNSATADVLRTLVLNVIKKCLEHGLKVVATCCKLSSVNIKCLNLLGSTRDRPIINVMEHDIVTIFDPPHLLNCFRTILMYRDIECPVDMQHGDTGIAKWEHIKFFYEIDSTNKFVFAPALTKDHLYPNGKQKMEVKYAAQVFSHSVAGGMYAKVWGNEMNSEAGVTASLVNRIDMLFDCLNADTDKRRRGYEFSCNITRKRRHLQYLKECREFFLKIRCVGSSTIPPTFDGWVQTINAVELLWNHLSQNNVKSLSTRRLNQDPLKIFLQCIRSHCGSNPNPPVRQFVAAIKTAMINSLMNISTETVRATITKY